MIIFTLNKLYLNGSLTFKNKEILLENNMVSFAEFGDLILLTDWYNTKGLLLKLELNQPETMSLEEIHLFIQT